jgi:hypothetical protein
MLEQLPAIQDILVRRSMRQKICALERSMHDLDGAFTNFDDWITHRFCNGIYAREIHIPGDTLVVAKIHNTEHFSVISQGSCLVLTEWGVEKLAAPMLFVSKRFTKRVVYTYAPTIWTTFHKTDKTDPNEIEEEVIAKDYAELEAAENEVLKQLEAA